ncbi:MAG TPA: ATP synthase subunit I [Gammaproteobacteria bacterium]|nr:ATP synthase subunit I [Gammaproteobacteria bacterium]
MRANSKDDGRLTGRPHRVRGALASLLAIQGVVALVIAAGFYVYGGPWSAAGVLYGGGVALAVSALLAFRLARASRPGASMAGLYLSAFERFFFVGGAIALGLTVVDLSAVPLLAGFAGAEAGYFIAAGVYPRNTG